VTFIRNGPDDSTIKIKWFNLQLIMGRTLYTLNSTDYEVLGAFNVQYNFSSSERGYCLDDTSCSLMAKYHGVIP
jgi:hypothetical protein